MLHSDMVCLMRCLLVLALEHFSEGEVFLLAGSVWESLLYEHLFPFVEIT